MNFIGKSRLAALVSLVVVTAACASAPQTNDVDVDERGLVYIVDRYTGFDILEFNR